VGYPPSASALVRRVSELTALRASLDRATAGHGNLTFLTGVPGIGTSRLALEASQLAARLDMSVLWGRCFEGETGRMFAPWVEALGGYLRELEWDRFQYKLGQTAATIAQIVPNLRGVLPGLPAIASTTPAEDRQRLFDAVVHLVLTAAHERAVLLVLDDLQWADRASLALLRQLARDVGESGVAILGTLRGEEVAAHHPLAELMMMLSREVAYQHITLTDLSLAEATELAELVLQQHSSDQTMANVDGVLAEVLFDQTGGNPFFIQEIARDLVDTGRLERRQEHWVAASPAATWDVPREVRDVVDRRLQRLPLSAQRLLRAACACTAGFTFADAQGLTGMEEELVLESVDAALRSQLLRVVDPPTLPARYDFGTRSSATRCTLRSIRTAELDCTCKLRGPWSVVHMRPRPLAEPTSQPAFGVHVNACPRCRSDLILSADEILALAQGSALPEGSRHAVEGIRACVNG
jgi:hypothetical protein